MEAAGKDTPVVKAVDYNRMLYAKKKREKEVRRPDVSGITELESASEARAGSSKHSCPQT